MKLLKILSRTGNFILLFCFFLPFAPVGCGGPSTAEIAEKMKDDSIHLADSIQKHGTSAPSGVSEMVDSIARISSQMLETDENRIVVSEPLWKVILSRLTLPGNAITGFGLVLMIGVDWTRQFRDNGSIALLDLCLVISYLTALCLAFYALWKKAYSKNWMVPLSLFGLICFCSFLIVLTYKDTLYGYWLTLSFWVINLLFMRSVCKREKSTN